MKLNNFFIYWFFFFAIDQILKFCVALKLEFGEAVYIFRDWILLTREVNNEWVIISIIVAILFVLILCLISPNHLILWKSLLIGGIASNLFDRAIYGGVIDYITITQVAFNLADVFIVVGIWGIIIGIINYFYSHRRGGNGCYI